VPVGTEFLSRYTAHGLRPRLFLFCPCRDIAKKNRFSGQQYSCMPKNDEDGINSNNFFCWRWLLAFLCENLRLKSSCLCVHWRLILASTRETLRLKSSCLCVHWRLILAFPCENLRLKSSCLCVHWRLILAPTRENLRLKPSCLCVHWRLILASTCENLRLKSVHRPDCRRKTCGSIPSRFLVCRR